MKARVLFMAAAVLLLLAPAAASAGDEAAPEVRITKAEMERTARRVEASLRIEKSGITGMGPLFSLDEEDRGYSRITLETREADLKDVVSLIASAAGLNYVFDYDVPSRRVTLRLVNVEWPTALKVLLETNGLAARVEGRVLRIGPFDRIIGLETNY